MARIFYLHWNADELSGHVRALKSAGHRVQAHSALSKSSDVGADPLDAYVISLDRLPSHGRAVAAVLWDSKKRRATPLIFVGGQPDKIKSTIKTFPHATYCQRDELLDVLKRLDGGLVSVPIEATKKKPSTSGYSGKPLPLKLGLAEGQRVAFLHSPEDWDDLIGPMPADVKRHSKPASDLDMVVLFVTDRKALAKEFPPIAARMAQGGMIWVAWPKKTARVTSDLDENVVREVGLNENWVDVKVCAVSEIWSGLKFLRRRNKSSR